MPTNRRRRWLRAAIIACVILLVLLGVSFILSRGEPTWWQEPSGTPEAKLAAEGIENAVVSELSRARPDDGATPEYRSAEWTLAITEMEANAWLATRAEAWAENRAGTWPAAIQSIQLAFRPGRLLAGVHLKQGGGLDHIVSISAIPDLHSDGSLWLKIDSAALGGLPLPSGVVLSQLRPLTSAASSAQILDALQGKRALLDQAVIKLDDGRYVRIVNAQAQKGQLILTCRTEKK